MTRRFDRPAPGAGRPRKLHLRSLRALARHDFHAVGAHALGFPVGASEELFRRAVFNVITRNQADLTKNIAWMTDQSVRWSPAPSTSSPTP